VAVSFIGGGNRTTRGKTTNLSQVTDTLNQIMLYRVHKHEIFKNVRMIITTL
jgi:hypothetical protein